MEVYDTIISRRTIRKFKQKPVKLSVLKRLVNAGRLAPSAGNLQPLEYIVIADGIVREKIFPHVRWARYIEPEGNPKEDERPMAYIIILINKENLLVPFYKYDVGASAENITLAALEKGIGCCWIGSFDRKKIKNILKITDDCSIDLILALGYPLEDPGYYDIEKDKSIKYHKDNSGKLHVPKRKLDDIVHIDHL
ncbi:MAG: nitroreductase family protein [Actinomycetota bacterium]|nr:nitroreductase family protein [Actinomycetota bacterium]